MTEDIGGAFVRIQPDMSGFAAELQAGMREAMAGVQFAGDPFQRVFATFREGAASAGSAASGVLRGALSEVASYGRSALEDTFNRAKGAAQGLAVVITGGVVGALVEGLRQASNFARVQDVFTAITHSASESQAIIQQLRETAINTGQSFDNLSRFSQQLLAAGVSNVGQVANALAVYATAFGRNTQSMQRAATQLQEIQLKGTLQAQQLNALVRDGVPAYQAATVAAENLGLAQKGAADEGAQVTDAMKAGKISAQAFFDALSDPRVIANASAAVAALQGNISFQMQKLQTEVQHTLGQLFTPLLQNLGTVLEPVTNAMGKITLNAEGLAKAGQLINDAIGGLAAPALQVLGRALNGVNDALDRLVHGQSLQNIEDRFRAIAPLLTVVSGAIAAIGADAISMFLPFEIGMNPLVAGMLALALSSKEVRDDLGILLGDAQKAAGILGGLLAPAVDAVQQAMSRAAQGAKPFLDYIGPGIDALGRALSSGNTQGIVNTVGGIATMLTGAVQSAVESAFGNIDWTTVGAALGGGIGTLARILGQVILSAVGEIDWNELGQAVGQHGPEFAIAFAIAFGKALFPAIKQTLSLSFTQAISDLGGPGGGIDTSNMPGIEALALNISQGLASAVLIFLSSTLFGPLGPFIVAGIEGALGVSLTNLGGVLAGWGGDLAGLFGQAFGSLFSTLGSLTSGLVGLLSQAFGSLFSTLGTIASGLGELLSQAFGSLFSTLGTLVSTGLQGLGVAVQTGIRQVAQGAVFVAVFLAVLAQETFDPVIAVFEGWFNDLSGNVAAIVAGMAATVISYFGGMAYGATAATGDMAGGVLGAIGSMVGGAFSWLGSMVSGALGYFGDMAGGVLGWIGSMVDSVFSWLGSMVGGALGYFGDMAGSAIGQAAGMAGGVIGQFAAMAGSAIGQAAGMAGGVLGWLGSMVGQAWGAASGFGANVAGAISSGVGSVMSAAGSLVSSAIAAASSSIGGAYEVGVGIVSGIASGILGAVGSVVSAAVSAVQKAVDAAKQAAGISSPSKLFRDEVGAPIAQGIALGIDGSSGGVLDAARRVVLGAAGVVGAAYGSTAATVAQGGSTTNQRGGDTYNLIGPDPATLLQQLRAQQQWANRKLGVAV